MVVTTCDTATREALPPQITHESGLKGQEEPPTETSSPPQHTVSDATTPAGMNAQAGEHQQQETNQQMAGQLEGSKTSPPPEEGQAGTHATLPASSQAKPAGHLAFPPPASPCPPTTESNQKDPTEKAGVGSGAGITAPPAAPPAPTPMDIQDKGTRSAPSESHTEDASRRGIQTAQAEPTRMKSSNDAAQEPQTSSEERAQDNFRHQLDLPPPENRRKAYANRAFRRGEDSASQGAIFSQNRLRQISRHLVDEGVEPQPFDHKNECDVEIHFKQQEYPHERNRPQIAYQDQYHSVRYLPTGAIKMTDTEVVEEPGIRKECVYFLKTSSQQPTQGSERAWAGFKTTSEDSSPTKTTMPQPHSKGSNAKQHTAQNKWLS